MAVRARQQRFYTVQMDPKIVLKESLIMRNGLRFKSVSIQCCGLVLFLFTSLAYAESLYIETSRAYSHPYAGSAADLESTMTSRIIAGVAVTPHFAIEVGMNEFSTQQDRRQEDEVSRYRVKIRSNDFLSGIKGQVSLNEAAVLYASTGWLFWDTEFELEEYFWGIAPSGFDEASDKGMGYYVTGGLRFYFAKHGYIDVYLSRHQRNGIFADVSDYPVTIREGLKGIGVGLSI